MVIDLKAKEIKFKIVYYGPGLSGKTTNLRYIYERFQGPKGKLLTIDTKGERTLFFDFLPIEIKILKGFKSRFYLYTVPGQVFYKISRKLVLRGADGVVFVADSGSNRLEENIAIYNEMHDYLKNLGLLNGRRLPIIMQYNKRDLPTALPVEELEEKVNIYKYPYHLAIAVEGKGVFKTLHHILLKVIKNFSKTRKQSLKK